MEGGHNGVSKQEKGGKERRKEPVNKAGDVVQLGDCLPGGHKSLRLIPNVALTRSRGL